ncbi:hypothetical protein SK128_015371 [Halocaridina rubra]|uniref:Neurotransmitter-gated ion-channel ligand-binding domain-containing protein n=1 Tax=Halocaridina rubra TaxID=373956 RepID=A0AAN8WSA2_HALRR
MRNPKEAVAAILFFIILSLAKADEDDYYKAAVAVKELLDENEPGIRPSVNNEPTTLKVQTYVRHIDIDEENDRVILDLSLRLKWNDYRLVFNAAEGVDYVTVLNPKLAWLPDPFFINGVVTYHKTVHKESFLGVYPNGTVYFSTRLTVSLYCPMDGSRSLDNNHEQSCVMTIASYGYTARELLFEWEGGKPSVFKSQLRSGKFSLERSENHDCVNSGDYSCVKLEMFLRQDRCS